MSTVLITGANRGLGLEFTKQYSADGWSVIACCRNPEKANILLGLAKSNGSIRVMALDTRDTKSIADLTKSLHSTVIDLLINNAGIYSGVPNAVLGDDQSQKLGSIDPQAWSIVFQVNTIAPIMMIEALLPNLKRGKDSKIINITSLMGSMSDMSAGSIAYRSSKTALNSAMRVIYHELKDDKIGIYNFHPGWVQTDMGGKNAHLTPLQSVMAMRQTIAKLTLSETGSYLNYDGKKIPW